MATFSAQVTDLIGGTIDQDACNQWAVDGTREIIMQLPTVLQERCSDKATLTDNSGVDLDTASYGKVMYCTRNNGSYDIPCRLISSAHAHLADDSTASNYYAVADDPAYFIRDNKVEIKPNPTGSQNGFVYHLKYPTSIDVDSDSAIASFPIECEYLVVLYVATKQLLQYQSSMSSSWNSDITTALTAVKTALVRINTHVWDDEETFLTANSQLTRVKDALDNAQNAVDNNMPASGFDASDQLQLEDLEMMGGALSIAGAELSRASAHLGEWGAIGGAAISEAQGFIGEASARLGADTAQYGWYGDQYAKLMAQYAAGLAVLKGA